MFLYAVVATVLAYWVTANAFLNFGVSRLFAGTNEVNATFQRAWSVYPGTVHVRDLRITFQDQNVQFELVLPVAEVDVRITALVSRTLRATRVRAEGVRFVMRHRIQPESKHEPWVAALPKIEGFPDPPLFESTVPSPPISDDEYDLWTIHLEDVDVGVAEIWTQFVRYRGDAVAKGAFRLRPARHLWVGPASLEIARGALTIGAQPLASSLAGKIDCVVHPFDVRVPVGTEVFRHISAGLALRAGGLRLEPVVLFFGGDVRPRVRSEPGALTLDARFDHGVMTEASRIRLETPELALEQERWLATASALDVRFDGVPGPGAELRVRWSGAKLGLRESALPPLEAGGLEAFLATSSRDTTADWEIVRGGVDLGELRVPDLGWVNDASRQALPRLGGALTLDGKGRYEMGVLEADARAQFTGAHARAGEVAMSLDGALELQLSKARLDEHSGRLIARLRGKSAGMDGPGAGVSASKLSLDAEVHAESGNARGFVEGTLGTLSAKTQAFDFAGDGRLKVVLDALDTRSLAAKGSAELALTKVSARHEIGRAEAEAFELTSDFERSRAGVWNAGLDSAIRGFEGTSKALAFAAEPALSGKISDYDPKTETGWVEGAVRIRDLRAAARDQSASCPVVRVSEARLDGRMDLDPTGSRGLINATVRGAAFHWDDFRASFGTDIAAHFRPRPNTSASHVSFKVRAREVRLASGTDEKAGWDADVPALSLAGTVDLDRRISGAIEIDTQAAGRIGHSHVEGDVSAALRLAELDLDGRRARLEGALRLTNATVRAGEQSVRGWWAGVELGSALVTAGTNLDVSSMFDAELRDAMPGLVALSAEDELPGWFVSVLPLQELRVKGTVNRRCRLTDIQFTSAHGGPLEGSGRMQSVPDAVRGAFLVRFSDFGALSAGIRFEPSSTDVTLLAGENWLEKRLDSLDASVKEVLEKPCLPQPSECSAD